MYTQEMYDKQLERYKDAPMKALQCVKGAYHLNPMLTETQQAQLAVCIDLIKVRKREQAREYSKTRYRNSKLALQRTSG